MTPRRLVTLATGLASVALLISAMQAGAFEAPAVAGQPSAELERVMGIEPTLAAWEAAVLPLNYTRLLPGF